MGFWWSLPIAKPKNYKSPDTEDQLGLPNILWEFQMFKAVIHTLTVTYGNRKSFHTARIYCVSAGGSTQHCTLKSHCLGSNPGSAMY